VVISYCDLAISNKFYLIGGNGKGAPMLKLEWGRKTNENFHLNAFSKGHRDTSVSSDFPCSQCLNKGKNFSDSVFRLITPFLYLRLQGESFGRSLFSGACVCVRGKGFPIRGTHTCVHADAAPSNPLWVPKTKIIN